MNVGPTLRRRREGAVVRQRRRVQVQQEAVAEEVERVALVSPASARELGRSRICIDQLTLALDRLPGRT